MAGHPVVEVWSDEEIAARLDELVTRTGLDLPVLRERAEDGLLSPEQWTLFQEIEPLLVLARR